MTMQYGFKMAFLKICNHLFIQLNHEMCLLLIVYALT